MSDLVGKRLRGFLYALGYFGNKRTQKRVQRLLSVQTGHLNISLPHSITCMMGKVETKRLWTREQEKAKWRGGPFFQALRCR